MKRIILLGAPGCGKGTQADILENKYGYKKISTGDLIRAEVVAETDIGRQVKDIMEKGQLVPDQSIINILEKRLKQGDIKNGYIMDGFPRTRQQAETLSRMEADSEVAIYLRIVNEDVVVKRLLSRLTCSQCGAIFNIQNNPPKVPGVCDLCGGTIKQRADDNEKTVRSRIDVYRKQTEPVVDYYKNKGILHEVQASGSVEKVFEAIEEVLN